MSCSELPELTPVFLNIHIWNFLANSQAPTIFIYLTLTTCNFGMVIPMQYYIVSKERERKVEGEGEREGEGEKRERERKRALILKWNY